jgi:hypothetical protein
MVKHIEIGGKTRPLLYNINALIEFEELTGDEILKTSLNMDLRSLKKIRALAYVGLKYGAKAEESTEIFTLEKVGDWINLSDETIPNIVKAFRSSNQGEDNGSESTEEAAPKN